MSFKTIPLACLAVVSLSAFAQPTETQLLSTIDNSTKTSMAFTTDNIAMQLDKALKQQLVVSVEQMEYSTNIALMASRKPINSDLKSRIRQAD